MGFVEILSNRGTRSTSLRVMSPTMLASEVLVSALSPSVLKKSSLGACHS